MTFSFLILVLLFVLTKLQIFHVKLINYNILKKDYFNLLTIPKLNGIHEVFEYFNFP